jgi:hypothetical protein
MIVASLDYLKSSDCYSLIVSGHAGFGIAGQDIVCAAVSTLSLTAASRLEEMADGGKLAREPIFNIKDGFLAIYAQAKPENWQEFAGILKFVRAGMQMVAGLYPDNIRLIGLLSPNGVDNRGFAPQTGRNKDSPTYNGQEVKQ